MKISIGVPAYNQGKFIKRTIDSLLKQSIQPYEILVCDNRSTDETAQVLQEYGSQIKVIKPPKHLTMMENWNFLVANLTGDWFSLLSSDDVALPNFVSTMNSGIKRSLQAILIRSGYELIDENDQVLEKRLILSVSKITKPPQTFYEQLYGPRVSFAAFCLKKSIWEKVGGFPEDCQLDGDWGLWLKVSPFGDFIYEEAIVSQCRTDYRPGLAQKRAAKELRDEIYIYTKLIPETISFISDINANTVIKASRERFCTTVSRAREMLDESEWEFNINVLNDWAELSGSKPEFEKLKKGENIILKKYQFPFRSVLRGFYQRIKELTLNI